MNKKLLLFFFLIPFSLVAMEPKYKQQLITSKEYPQSVPASNPQLNSAEHKEPVNQTNHLKISAAIMNDLLQSTSFILLVLLSG